MSATGTLGQLWLRSILPPDVYNGEVLDKKTLSKVLSDVAKKYPDKYRDITFRLNQLGRQSAYFTGGNSFGLAHLRKAAIAVENRKKLQPILDAIVDDDSLDSAARTKKIAEVLGPLVTQERDQIYDESDKSGNPLAQQLKGAGRGNKINLAALLGSNGLYTDQRGRLLPVPVLRNYSEGLSPMEYLASTFGGRQGLIQTKFSVADSGFFGKQLVQAAHRLVVEALDADKEPDTVRGLPVDVDDPDNDGSLLAMDTGGYKRNTILTPRILRELQQQGLKRILVRSPTAFGTPNGGVYARDIGVREFGRLPNVGERVGITGAQAVAEPLSQGMLCLAAGTLVRMADGTSKSIADIVVGDYVLGATVDGQRISTRVLQTFNNGPRACVETKFQLAVNQELSLKSTIDHKILATTTNVQSDNVITAFTVLPVGVCTDNSAVVLLPDTPKPVFCPKLASTDIGELATYDITVEHSDHLFVLANGLVVSNSGKHSAGVAGASSTQSLFDTVNQMIQVPAHIKGGGTHARVNGIVRNIEDAPAGGKYIYIDGERHFAALGFNPKVKPGDTVEAGDLLTDGLPNPALVVQHKGVGEGRRYFVQEFRKAVRDGGVTTDRRNIELLARGLINHVRFTEDVDDYSPDDVVPYSVLEHTYKPREGFQTVAPKQAVGKYLERPYLHYTIGTKVQPSMLRDFEEFNIPQVDVHDNAPPFEPEMVRAMANLRHDPDWIVREFGSYLKEGLLDAVHRGATSDQTGTSYVPSLAQGVNFRDFQPKPAASTAVKSVKVPTQSSAVDQTVPRNTPGEF